MDNILLYGLYGRYTITSASCGIGQSTEKDKDELDCGDYTLCK